jgi:RND family efflux transporter MFP subunit
MLALTILLLFTTNNYAAEKPASLVQTAPIHSGSLISYQSFIGTLYYSESSIVASQMAGLALKVNFDTTNQVAKKQVLVELDHQIIDSKIYAIKASIKELHLQLEKLNKDLHRYTTLLKHKNVSQQKYDEIYYNKITLEQKLIALKAQMDILKIERNQSIIRAPFDGFITQKEVSLGEWVEKGGAIARLVNPYKMYIIFDIPSHYVASLDFEKAIKVQINQKTYSAHIEGLIIQGDAQTRTIPLKIKLDKGDKSFFAGMEAEIKLARNTHSNTLLLPRDAVIKRFGQDVVFSIKEGKAQMIPVDVKLYQGSQVAVVAEDLNLQMRVITKGNERVFPDQAVFENSVQKTVENSVQKTVENSVEKTVENSVEKTDENTLEKVVESK